MLCSTCPSRCWNTFPRRSGPRMPRTGLRTLAERDRAGGAPVPAPAHRGSGVAGDVRCDHGRRPPTAGADPGRRGAADGAERPGCPMRTPVAQYRREVERALSEQAPPQEGCAAAIPIGRRCPTSVPGSRATWVRKQTVDGSRGALRDRIGIQALFDPQPGRRRSREGGARLGRGGRGDARHVPEEQRAGGDGRRGRPFRTARVRRHRCGASGSTPAVAATRTGGTGSASGPGHDRRSVRRTAVPTRRSRSNALWSAL